MVENGELRCPNCNAEVDPDVNEWMMRDGADTPMPDSLAAVVSDMEDKANRLKALLEPDDPPLLDKGDTAILTDLKPYAVVKPAEESQRLRELGVLERRYYIDQVFDALTDKGEKALEFASHIERVW